MDDFFFFGLTTFLKKMPFSLATGSGLDELDMQVRGPSSVLALQRAMHAYRTCE